MSQISYSQASAQFTANNSNGGNGPRVGFFSLQNDGEEAVVRFVYNTPDDFNILTVHPSTVNGKFRNINCIRTPQEPIDMCPLCSNNRAVKNSFFIKLLQYTTGADGTINVEAKVWERSMAYANKLVMFMNNYGPLQDYVCKIIRHGRRGDTNTTYDIIPLPNSPMYPNDRYPNKPELFEGYNPLGTAVINRKFEALQTFIETGNFPQYTQNNQAGPVNNTPVPASPQPVVTTPVQQPVTVQPTHMYVPNNSTGAVPWNTPEPTTGTPWDTAPAVERPVRYY